MLTRSHTNTNTPRSYGRHIHSTVNPMRTGPAKLPITVLHWDTPSRCNDPMNIMHKLQFYEYVAFNVDDCLVTDEYMDCVEAAGLHPIFVDIELNRQRYLVFGDTSYGRTYIQDIIISHQGRMYQKAYDNRHGVFEPYDGDYMDY
jgi:hypothetical protein